ncbi:MAG: hypothetical protein ABIP17_12095 [Ilumatobacteraceae bacterium]
MENVVRPVPATHAPAQTVVAFVTLLFRSVEEGAIGLRMTEAVMPTASVSASRRRSARVG